MSDLESARDGISSTDLLNLDILVETVQPQEAADGGASGSVGQVLLPPPCLSTVCCYLEDAFTPHQGGKVKLSVADRESTLRFLVEEGWLEEKMQRERFRVGPRTFLELASWINNAATPSVQSWMSAETHGGI